MTEQLKRDNTHVINPKHAWTLTNRFRNFMQPPVKILNGTIKEGAQVMDFGCGTGYLTTTIANQVGKKGKVYAVDLQTEMLNKLKKNISGTGLENRIEIQQCNEVEIGLNKKVDTIVTCYVLHEVPNQSSTLKQFYDSLESNGIFYLVEPPFHVKKSAFESQIQKAKDVGFELVQQGKIGLNHTALFKKN